jgi:hypothetical protein
MPQSSEDGSGFVLSSGWGVAARASALPYRGSRWSLSLDANDQVVFHSATELCDEVFAKLQGTLRRRILRYFCRHGYLVFCG